MLNYVNPVSVQKLIFKNLLKGRDRFGSRQVSFLKKVFLETQPHMHAHKLGQMAILSGSYHAIITAYHLVLKFNQSVSLHYWTTSKLLQGLRLSLFPSASGTKGSKNICKSK